MKNLKKGLILVKVLFSLFISYLVIFKGDAGSLINTIGSVIVAGNYITGLIYTITILAIYPLLLHNLTLNVTNLNSLKNKLLTFDIVVITTNFILSFFINNKIYQMPMEDALSKYGVLTAGITLLFILSTIILLAILRKLDAEASTSKDLLYNKNPLSFVGKISRLPYFVTKLVLFVITTIPVIYKSMNNQVEEMQFLILQFIILQIVFILAFYAASKRLRDIQWSQWLLLPWIIPFVGLAVGLPLFFVKSKTDSTTNKE